MWNGGGGQDDTPLQVHVQLTMVKIGVQEDSSWLLLRLPVQRPPQVIDMSPPDTASPKPDPAMTGEMVS